MTEPPASVDGITPPAAPASPSGGSIPGAPSPSPAVRRWKKLLLLIGGTAYALYVLWAAGLMLLLPTPTGDLQELVPLGTLTALVAGLVFLAIGGIGFIRVKDSSVPANRKQIALIKLVAIVVPGLILSMAMPVLIRREPKLSIVIVAPAAGEELVAPLSMTFSVEEAVSILKKRGINPIQYRWDLNADKEPDQETVVPQLIATFDREGIYTVSVTMVASNGETRSASRRFVVQQSVFSISPNPPIVEKPVVFSLAHFNTKENPIMEVQWDFDGDGKTDETTKSPEATYTYFRLGKVRPVALVQYTNRTQGKYERTIDVSEPPKLPFPITLHTEPKYLISPSPFSVLLRVETEEPLGQVQWNFGDGSRAEGPKVAHTYDKKGNFPVTVRARSQSGVLAELAAVVQVVDTLALPDLSFDGTPQVNNDRISGEVPVTLNLKPRTNVPFVQFFWEAPEATEVGSTDTTLQAIYRREGTYTVTLIAKDAENHVLRRAITVEVKPPSSSLAFQMNPETGVAPLEVQFDASETFIPNETITGFEWNFGDRSPPQFGGARARHTFEQPNTYIIELIVRTTSGNEFRTTRTIVVRSAPITACFMPSRTRGTAPMGVTFDNCSSGNIVSYLWDFGDGASTDEAAPVHVFEGAGTFRVVLTVTDAGGRTAKYTVPITVTP